MIVPFAAACLSAPLSTFAQSYPTKPIRIVIPYPPGGVDITVRLLLPILDQELGQPGIIDYRPGASGLIGTEYVSNADPDGYTILWTASNPWVVTPAMRKETPYHPIKSFTPITVVTEGVNVIVASKDFPANNLTELFAYARKNSLAWATSGIGSSWHLDAENMNRMAHTKILHAPFKGFGPMFPAMFSGQPPVGLITYSTSYKLVQSGKLKFLGSMSTKEKVRHLLPKGMQTIQEVLPEFEASSSWVGVGGPANLPRDIVMRLNAAIIKAIKLPLLQERFASDLIVATGNTPEEFAKLIKDDYELAVKSVRESGISSLD
ncbi:MAG: hypothetical protein A3H35_04565 [Betaproteobacteria bacterium RIFCSPLOWO2_02_FULL_62_17]|nr:MAG: hypothetical protein A3H35_04565 [Betaproteobacteria bacterium RIFCSPLOWO2_02_FULL_62_17]